MNSNDERDYAEEAFNRATMRDESEREPFAPTVDHDCSFCEQPSLVAVAGKCPIPGTPLDWTYGCVNHYRIVFDTAETTDGPYRYGLVRDGNGEHVTQDELEKWIHETTVKEWK